jgi:NADPH:quinone reductase-like Zn-dependent oxidoreductase
LETRFPVASPQQNKPGDEVFYAGSILRQGTNSEFHLVDERIVGKKPKLLSFAQAAALPLTSIIAWELLLDRLGALPGRSVDPRTLLITGGAGGVGSILIQLARRLTGLTVVATATRGRAAHCAGSDVWDDQRRQSQARACAAGKRQIARRDRAGGVAGVRPSASSWPGIAVLRTVMPGHDGERQLNHRHALDKDQPPVQCGSPHF